MQKIELIKNEWVEIPIPKGTLKVVGSCDSTVLVGTSDTKPNVDLGIEIGSWQNGQPFDGNSKKYGLNG